MIPEQVGRLLAGAPNVTLEVPYKSARAMGLNLLIWASFRSLTILTDDFPTHDFLHFIPSSLDLLIIRFKAHCCRSQPHYLDRRMFGFLEFRAIKNVRVCISTFYAMWCMDFVNILAGPSFTKPDSSLFVKTRTLCIERGGQFILENPFGVPEGNLDTEVGDEAT